MVYLIENEAVRAKDHRSTSFCRRGDLAVYSRVNEKNGIHGYPKRNS